MKFTIDEDTGFLKRFAVTLLAVTMLMIVTLCLLATLPIWLPLHFILRACGRTGFILTDEDGQHFSVVIGPAGFKRPDKLSA